MDSNKKTKSYFVDRISELPECIMHHILSFLPTKEVARTSVLSQRWNSVSTCFPILDFDESSFGVEGPSDYEALEKFINIVDCTLHKFCTRKLQVQKFKLFITHNHRFEIPVKKWIDQLTKNQVRELDFHTPKPKGRDGYYPVPQTTFAAKSLISLNLNGCYLAQPFSKDNIKCCSLTILSLEEVYVTEMIIQLLISSCPLIEVIVLKNCQGFSKLSVSGLLKLKTIKVIPCVCCGLESINIESPSLQSFYFRFGSIFQLHTINVSACQGLRNLTLIRALVTNQMFLSIASNLPFLEYLFLASCDVPQRVKISSRRLMRLTLRDCEMLEEAEIDTPDLNSFQFVGQTLPLFSSLNAPCQLEVLLYLVTQPDALWHQKLNEFLKKANQAKVLTLIITSSEIIWNKNMEVVNDFSLRAPKTPAQWSLHMQSLSLSFSALLDKFLVNCCPNMLFIVSDSTSENKFVKNLCEKLMDRTYPYCCISRYFDFWWKMLNVKIANFEETKDGKPLCCNALLEEAMPTLHERQKFCFRLQWEYPHTCGGQTEFLRSLE